MNEPSTESPGGGAPLDRPGAEGRARVPAREALSDREASEYAGVVGGLVAAGVPLPGALRALGDESESARLRGGLHRLADRVERGESLAEAIAAEGGRLPGHLPGVVRAAERSGRPQEVLLEAARFERMGEELVRHLVARLAYPTLLLGAFALVFQLIARFVAIDLIEVYTDFGLTMPALTVVLIALCRWVVAAGWALPLGILAAIGLAWWAATGVGRRSRRRMADGLPVLGRIGRLAAMAEFAGLLALLVESRLALPEALALAGRGVRDPDLIAACDGAAREVERGRSLRDACRAFRLFPAGFDRLLGWAEANHALPDALRLASDVYAARARATATTLGVFLSAMAVTFVLLGVILTVVGLYLPTIRLIS